MKTNEVLMESPPGVEPPTDGEYCCPNCQGCGVRVFYQTGDVPVHSRLMLDDEELARAFPRRPIRLGLCPSCGFVSNVAFDPSVHDHTGSYEDQLSFSNRYREFQTGLIARLIDGYDLRGKDVIEIGCGRGDFLVELCRAGRNRGVGIDPRGDPRQNDPAGGIRFIPEYYSQHHWQLPCDFLCCQFTLEHVYQTDALVASVRAALEDKPDAIVFFDVPDATRIWREQAFWDIFYEHCSYFTPGSLAQLFRRNRFEVIELDRVFGNQYLMIVARPVQRPSEGALAIEDSLARATQDVVTFSEAVNVSIEQWRSRLDALCRGGKRVAVWGASSKCVTFLSTLDRADAIDTVVDINPHQQGKYLPGVGTQVMAPESLRTRRPDAVLIMNPAYREEIDRQLHDMGVVADLVCI